MQETKHEGVLTSFSPLKPSRKPVETGWNIFRSLFPAVNGWANGKVPASVPTLDSRLCINL
jgi:hypothetical protein